MKKLLYLTITFILLLASCKKKEFPQNVSEDPAFYINANIDGAPVSIKAGMLGYYMFSDHKQDSNGIYSFIAELKPSNCNSLCNNTIKIEINDDQTSLVGASSNITNSIKPGDYSFANTALSTPALLGYAVHYTSIFNKTALSYNWTFGDGGVSSEANPTHTFALAANYNSCLTIYDSMGYSNVCNTVKVTNRTNPCITHISIASVAGNSIYFKQQTYGTEPFNYFWDFGDGNYSSQANPSHTYSAPGLYLARLKVVDAINDSASFNYFINTDQSIKSASNYSISTSTALYSNILPSLFSKIKISYTDDNGVTYTSNTMQQPVGSNFTIDSVEDFKVNSKDQTTKKLKIKFNCKLNNGSSLVHITDGEAVIAVSYK